MDTETAINIALADETLIGRAVLVDSQGVMIQGYPLDLECVPCGGHGETLEWNRELNCWDNAKPCERCDGTGGVL